MKTGRLTRIGYIGITVIVMAVFRTIAISDESNRSGSVKLEGDFKPFESYDNKIKDKLVMKPQPKCGTCHARAVISKTDDGKSHLRLSVDHGKVTNSWDMAGIDGTNGLCFSKPKIQLAYTNGVLTGEYNGKMRARISLKTQ
ncbi:MAG: hypothetical protein PHR77_17650 [Kiritimatiellae bacterium]|nr:hypothetical protein [Kiritimatiellia bacterium]MDD5522769.1 hypothetical protein [Kiritimatiellia bacterium]